LIPVLHACIGIIDIEINKEISLALLKAAQGMK
jgi:hypothetical protein